MRWPEVASVFAAERSRDLLAWAGGPVLCDGVEISLRGRILSTVDAEADAVVFRGDDRRMIALHFTDEGLTVVESTLEGMEACRWQADPGEGDLTDVLIGADGSVVLVLEDEVVAMRPGEIRRWRPEAQLLHWDGEVAVATTDRGPYPGEIRWWRPGGDVLATVTGTWLDAAKGLALVETPGELQLRDHHGVVARIRLDAHLADAKILRPDRIVTVSTVDGRDELALVSPGTGERRVLATDGRIRLRASHAGGVGVHGSSTLGASWWGWLDPGGRFRTAPGDVTAYPGEARVRHIDHLRAVVFEPREHRGRMVVALHGGPESLEQDELRFDGLYRHFLGQGVVVAGLNYAGSLGYGEEHRRRPWHDWAAVFTEDLRRILAFAAERGIDRVALFGGSFGGTLALLAPTLVPGLAGVVACAPVADLPRHTARAAQAHPAYRDWFGARFGRTDFTLDALARADVPVVVVHGDEDVVASHADSVELVGRAGRTWKLVTEPGTGHVPDTPEESVERGEHVARAVEEILDIAEAVHPAGRTASAEGSVTSAATA